MVNNLWLIKRPADFPEADMLEPEDMIVLIQDAVLRVPTIENWVACKEDAVARNIKIPENKLMDYEDIIDLIEKANTVIVW
ncbi:tRNA 2-thiouridine synthesizing protein B [Persephonella hydrogeniphila]|uniref:tRNA 2-thiouridine synthesizing protein B n=1 Tax=Persephonella hydrogeniphila TaxID=198703 RepID=A0A285NL63_9AQUI|nr:DsrH/TusB family sulfur metabolism protein [Persephonella hydrogeniphila]SNZ09663.1 tRNA 2-thiouridine synthesizing protein B [Persephonella hydrogeniphila]